MSLKGKINKMNNVQGEFVEGFESDLMKIMRENSSKHIQRAVLLDSSGMSNLKQLL